MDRSFTRRFSRETVLPVTGLLLPVVVWAAALLRTQSTLAGLDNVFYFYPMTAFGMGQWRAGMAPLWTSHIQSGFPLLADGQGALLYPLNLLTYFLFPAPLAFNAGVALQVVFAAVLMYLFVRTLGAGRWPSVIAGWIHVFAGAISGNLGSPALNGLVWWPLLFLLAERISLRPNAVLAAAAGVVMGLGWLGGFPQTTLYGIASASAFLVFRAWPADRSGCRRFFYSAAAWAASILAGIGIGAIQLLPTLEMSAFSVRAGGVDFALASQGSMFPAGFAGFLLPNWKFLSEYGLAGHNLYIGFLPLGAALLSLSRIKDRRVLFFLLLAVSGCLLSIGKFNPVYPYIYHLPGLHFLRIPARFLYWTTFSMAVLSAFGMDQVFASSPRAKEIRRLFTLQVLLTIIAAAGIALGTWILRLHGDSLLRVAQEYAGRLQLSRAYRLQGAAYYDSRIHQMLERIAGILNPFSFAVAGSLALALFAAAVLYIWSRRTAVRWAQPVLAVCIVSDLLLFAAPAIVMERPSVSLPSGASAAQSGRTRLYELTTQADVLKGTAAYSSLSANRNLLYAVDSVGAYTALGSRRYFELLRPLGSVNLAFGLPPVEEKDLIRSRPLLNFLNAGFVQSNAPLNSAGFEPVQSGNSFLYRNPDALPRAFVVPEAKVVRDFEETRRMMQSPEFDPRAAVLLEAPVPGTENKGKASTAQIQVYTHRWVQLRAEGPGWLVLSDLDYPGWEAFVDGKATRIYRGNYAFRTLPLASGMHRIEFKFHSTSFQRGAVLSVATAVLLLLAFICTKWQHSRVKHGS